MVAAKRSRKRVMAITSSPPTAPHLQDTHPRLLLTSHRSMASESCCPPGSWPGLVEDTAHALAGTTATFPSGLDYYYTAPPARSTKGIIVAYDVHGFKGGRVKSVCDSIAAAGFHVIMPGSSRHRANQQAASSSARATHRHWRQGVHCAAAAVHLTSFLPLLICLPPPLLSSHSRALLL